MVKKTAGFPTVGIKHRGLFSLSGMLQDIRKWYEYNDYKFHEPKYKYKVPSPAGAEQEIIIYGERKITEYLRYKISIYMHLWDIKEVEVIKDGQRIKANDGKVLIEITSTYDLDWQNRYKGTFLEGLQEFYHKYIIKRVIADWWEDNLVMKQVSLVKTIKNSLAFEEMKAIT